MTSLLRFSAALLLGAALTPAARAGMEIIAHRGANMLAPENTLASQRLAYELGAEYVEADVRVSADGIPFNLHDHDVDRTTNGTGLAGNMTMAQLKQLDAGIKFGARFAGERIPTIAENLEVAKQYNRKMVFDIKGAYMDPMVVDVVKRSGIALNQILFLTYWDEMTSPYIAKLPGCNMMRAPVKPVTGETIRSELVTDADLEFLRVRKVSTLIFGFGYINKADVDRFHDAGFKVSGLYHPAASAFYYQDMGLDSFWTDYTDVSVGNLTRTEQAWNNWADGAGLAPDQRHTWMDPDGDGQDNLTEFSFGTDPLRAGIIPMSLTRTPSSLTWTMDMREDWSQFVTPTLQNMATGPWYNLPGSLLNTVSPTRIQFTAPLNQGKLYYRMKFDLIR